MPESTTTRNEPPAAGTAGATAIMMAGIIASNLTGLLRMRVYSHLFGMTRQTDAYVMAFSVPDIMYNLVAGGALAACFVPVFAGLLATGQKQQAWRAFRAVFTVIAGLGTALVVLGIVFAPQITDRIAPAFSAEQKVLCVRLMRIIFPAELCFALGGLMMGALNAHGVFAYSAAAPATYNLFIVIGALVVGKAAGRGIEGMAWGAVGGAFVGQVLLQGGPILRRGGSFHLLWEPANTHLRAVLKMLPPVSFGLCLWQINTLVSRWIASNLPVGSVTALENATRIFFIPIALFGTGMGVPLLPALSRYFALHEAAEFRRTLSSTLRGTLFFTLPSSAMCLAMALPVVQAIFQSGHFKPEDSERTAAVLRILALGMPFVVLQQMVVRAQYARRDWMPVVSVGVCGVLACLGLNLMLYRRFGLVGIAAVNAAVLAGTSLSQTALLRARMGSMDGRRVARCALNCLVCCVPAVGAVLLVGKFAYLFRPAGVLAPVVQVIIGAALGGAAYLLAAMGMRMPEFRSGVDMLKRKLGVGQALDSGTG